MAGYRRMNSESLTNHVMADRRSIVLHLGGESIGKVF